MSTSRQGKAKARGKAFEQRVARETGGQVYPGQAGDVDAYGLRIECKYRGDLAGYGELANHLEQALDNSRRSGKPWALVITGGRQFHNDQWFVVIPFEEWERLRGVSANTGDDEAVRELNAALERFLDRRNPERGGQEPG